MSEVEEYITELKEKLSSLKLPEGFNLDLATSKELLDYVLPLFMPLMSVFLEAKSKEKEKTDEINIDFVEPFLTGKEIEQDLPPGDSVAEGTMDFLAQAEQVYNFFNTTTPFKHILGVGKVMAYFTGMIAAQMSGHVEKARQKTNAEIRPNVLDIDSVTKLHFRRPDLSSVVDELFPKHGLSDYHKQLYLEVAENILDPGMIMKLRFREEIDDIEAQRRLKMAGFPEEEYDKIKTVFTQFPQISDIVRFAVREAYSDTIAADLGLDDEREQKFDEEAAKIGADPTLSKNAWRAHWEVPSVMFMRELLHRKFIEPEDVDLLLKVHDILPRFREPMRKAMYNPITRVDIRRMYEDDVFDDAEVTKRYEATGYNIDDAKKLTEWTVKRYNNERKLLAKSSILQLYKHKEFTFEDAVTELRKLKYSEDIATWLLIEFDLKEEDKYIKKRVSYIKKAFINGFYTADYVSNQLSQLGYNSEYIKVVLDEWHVDFSLKVKSLSVEQIQKLYIKGIMIPQVAREYLHNAGYTDTDVQYLMRLWELDKK